MTRQTSLSAAYRSGQFAISFEIFPPKTAEGDDALWTNVAPLAAFEQTTAEAFDEVVNVNIRSIYLGTQAVWPVMRASGGGVIVSVSSLAAVSPFTGFSAYGASKAWLDIVTKAWADEGRAHGIRAYSVRPGAVATPMLAGLFPDFPAEQTVSADEVADVICQLALPPWRFSSGEAFTVSRQ